jgi:hypothetical protein
MLISTGFHPKPVVQYWMQNKGLSGSHMCAIEQLLAIERKSINE